MAVTATPIEKLLPSQPDVSALNQFSGFTVTVTKHPQPRNSPGSMVVTTQQMTKQQVLELQTSLPLQHGPGYYRFEVTDTGGAGDVKWMLKAGADLPEVPFMNTVPSQASPSTPTGDDVINLGNGYFYNSTLNTLTTPWRQIYSWTQGQPFPTPPTPANGMQSAALAPAASTPWSSGMPFMPPGFGYPNADDNRVRELEARLASETRQREAEQRAREADNQRDEMRRMREESDRRAEETTRRFEAMFTKLSEKPSGPDPAVERLERELAETKRLQEQRDREDRLRAEMRTMQENTDRIVRELTANKSDPMLTMLTQIMTESQKSSAAAVQAIRDSIATATGASERQIQTTLQQLSAQNISPLQLMQIVQQAKGDSNELSRTLFAGAKEMLEMQKTVFGQLLDVAGQQGQPAWVSLAQQAMEKIGTIGAAVAESRAQQPQVQQQQRVQQPSQVRGSAAPQQRVAAAPLPAQGIESPEQVRARLASGVQHLQPAPQTSVHAAPLNGATGPAIAANGGPVPIVEVVEPAVIPPETRAPRSSRTPRPRRRSVVAGDAPLTGAQLREMNPKQLAADLKKTVTDEVLFASLIAAVKQLRANVATLKPDQMAAYVLQGRDEIVRARNITIDSGGVPDPIPPALELLFVEQYEVLIDRVLPGVDGDYRAAVVEQLATMIAAETGTVVDDDEEDEDSEDDEDGDTEVRG